MVKVIYEDLPPIFSIDEAIQHKSFFPTIRNIRKGEVQQAFDRSDDVVDGEIQMGGQEHFYFETQGSIVVPSDSDFIVYTSTQNANKTQKMVASVLGLRSHQVICKVGRIGGGFGGKETRNINFSCAAAVAAHHLNRPVRLILERDVDMSISGYMRFNEVI